MSLSLEYLSNFGSKNLKIGTLNTKQGSSELRRKGHDRRWQAVGSSSVVQAAQAQKVVATSNKLQLRAFAPSARATSYNRYIVYRRYLLLPPLCPSLHGVHICKVKVY